MTAADYADTGQWRLIVRIYPDGMTAHLENTLHSDVEPQELFTSKWDVDSGALLQHIENSVYDHPRMLDDFSARITVYDPRTAFIPTELLLDTEGVEDHYYTMLYGGEPEDVMVDTDRDVTATSCLVAGLKGFLNRTFPGARVCNHLMEEVRHERKKGDGKRLKITLREKDADFVLLDGEKLLSATTRNYFEGGDIAYYSFNLFSVYGVNPKEVSVESCGVEMPDDAKEAFGKFTRMED